MTIHNFDEIDEKYYYGGRLGAIYSRHQTEFRVWSPCADKVKVRLYPDGDDSSPIAIVNMKCKDGVWSAIVCDDLDGVYYTYEIHIDGEEFETIDIYAVTAGVNGKRGMVLDLTAAEPDGWALTEPVTLEKYTDAIIYELHVRDFSIDRSGHFRNKGRFLAFTETGVTNNMGDEIGLDYIESLGVTHIHLLPVFDFATVDESSSLPQFNWGYDPLNYEPVISDKNHPYYFQGLNLLSLLDEQSEHPDQAIEALEAVLADTAGTPFMKGKAHFRLAGLYYKKENWDKAREHYKAKEIELLNVRERQTAGEQAAECLINKQEYLKGADEYKELYRNPEYESKQSEYLVRIGEATLLGGRYPDAFVIFQKVNTEYPRSTMASRSYYNLGDYEQNKTLDYEKAIVYYDSSFVSRSISEWAKKSRERRDALRRLIALRGQSDDMKKDSIPNMDRFFGTEFQIAELFLFKLSEVDSAIARLTNIIESTDDSAKVLRASYARAFIYDEFKGDVDTAEELYKEVIEKFPNTEYAKQAQVNLGMKVTVKTPDDEARDMYMRAESLWTIASEMPLDQMELVDTAYATAFYVFDSLYQQYPETEAGIQALYMKAIYFQMNPERLDSAAAVYRVLRDKHGRTRWGQQAASVLNTRLKLSEMDLERLRKRVAQSLEHIDRLSAQYYESLAKKPEEKKAEVKSKEDEVLENTYNSMYDFE